MRARRHIARRHLALAAVVAGGAGIRVWFMRSYRPAFMGYPDSRAYLVAARGHLYFNPYKPVGYPLLLRGLRRLDGRLSVTIAAQHLLGLGTAACVYCATVPFLRRRELGAVPAAVVAFSGSQVWLEHSLLSDGPYAFLLAAALCCVARSRAAKSDGPSPGALACASGALAAATTLRTVGLFVVPVLGAWALAQPGSGRRRLARAAGSVAPAAAVLIAYLVPQHRATGSWGLTRSGSFASYGRMAPLADCRRFIPPAGTEQLCEDSDPAERPNLNWYLFDLDSPANRLYGPLPWPLERVPWSEYRWAGEEPTRRFARAVLVHQPLDFVRTVLEGLANYVAPRTGRRSVFEYDQSLLIRELRNEHYERLSEPEIAAFYETGPGFRRRSVGALEAYGRAARTEGVATAVLAVLATSAVVFSQGATRSAATLFTATALTLATAPVATLFYDVRYAAPMVVPLSAAAAIGVDRLLDRWEAITPAT